MENRINEFCSANRNYIDTTELKHYLIDEFGEDYLTDFGVEYNADLIFVSFRIETEEECFDVDLTIEENFENEELEIVDYSIYS